MSDEKRMAPIDRLPVDVRALVESTVNLLTMYFPGREQIEMQVGRSTKAVLKFEGGPITREVIEDTMAHLAFYKKYFPKDGDQHTMALDSPEKILDALVAAWEVHRETMRQEGLIESVPSAPASVQLSAPTPDRKSSRHYQSNFEPT